MSFFQMKGGRAGGSRHVVACISKEDFNSGDYPSYKKATPCDGGTMMRVVMSMQHFAEHEEASKNRIKLWMQGTTGRKFRSTNLIAVRCTQVSARRRKTVSVG